MKSIVQGRWGNSKAQLYLAASKVAIKKTSEMNKWQVKFLRSGSFFVTLGITLEGARQIGLPEQLKAYINIPDFLGLLLVGVGLIFFVVWIIIALWKNASIALDRQFQKFREAHLRGLHLQEPTHELLSKVRKRGIEVTGDNTFIPLETMQWLVDKNKLYVKAWASSSTDDKIHSKNIGCFYIVAPLTKKACEKMLIRSIQRNRDLTPNDVCKSFKRAHGLYVIEVFGTNFILKGSILYLLRTEMLQEIFKSTTLRFIFTRPVNNFGLRQVCKLGFLSIGPHPYDMKMLDLWGN
ncbi:MAG: hypothetical protein KC643_25260 [Nitrospira sp.]|nr:hypothetical protein [Nitrospira sp.]MCB9710456.1 hypothetical protein [Nitrospiraceae bacterium]